MNTLLRHGLNCLTLSLSLSLTMSVSAQPTSPIPGVVPTTDEHRAISISTSTGTSNPVVGVRHTGTDAINYVGNDPSVNDSYVEDQTLQINTWDDADGVHVAWQFYDDRAGVNVLLPQPHQQFRQVGQALPVIPVRNPVGGTSDPDIVLAYAPDGSGTLYANLVYLDGDKVQYAVYRWNTYWRNFDAPTVTQLGNTNYDHSYPNIDANRNGLIAVTWQQTVTTQVVVSVTSVANFFPSYSFPQTVSFGRTVLATGDITGNFQSCYRDQLTGTVGMYAINPPTGLFEQTLHPDVAISEGDENRAIVSSTFLRHHVDGQELFSIVNELAVVQFPFLGSCRAAEAPNQHIIQLSALAERYWPYSQNNVLGSPRIASPSYDPSTNRLYDVEVAVDRTEANCGPYQYAIWNFGKTNGAFRDEYTMISPLQPPTFKDPNLIKAVEPAISFSAVMPNRNGTVSSTYTITFTGGPGFQDGGTGDDVWGVSLYDGIHTGTGQSGPIAQPAVYGRINLQGDGNQFAPSVAGRHMIGNTFAKMLKEMNSKYGQQFAIVPGPQPVVHAFFDEARQQISFRRTGDGPYAPYARPIAPTHPALQAYPNPSDATFRLTLTLQPAEKVRSLAVYDAMGRLTAELSTQMSGEGATEWKPDAKVPAGVYTVRMVTNQRTSNVTLVRK